MPAPPAMTRASPWLRVATQAAFGSRSSAASSLVTPSMATGSEGHRLWSWLAGWSRTSCSTTTTQPSSATSRSLTHSARRAAHEARVSERTVCGGGKTPAQGSVAAARRAVLVAAAAGGGVQRVDAAAGFGSSSYARSERLLSVTWPLALSRVCVHYYGRLHVRRRDRDVRAKGTHGMLRSDGCSGWVRRWVGYGAGRQERALRTER